jgi:competence protein ComEA
MLRFAALLVAALPLSALAIVNVNTAQQSDLQRTKGLDKHKAKAIIEYRAQHGTIDDLEELGKIPGFTKETLDKVKPEVAFAGDAFVPTPKAEKPKPKDK